MKPLVRIPCAVMRGGTSKGLFFLEDALPPAGQARDRFLLTAMGSPDPRQIDGMGGAASVTSKVAIISRSARPDADVDYTFAQVSVDKPIVSYRGNCGNISSAVGPFAIERGLVAAKEPQTTVRIYNTNTQKVIAAEVQVQGGRVLYQGNYAIAGVPGTAAPVKLRFCRPAGSVTLGLLPTGNVQDILEVPGVGAVPVSIVDAANPLVFVNAQALGLQGDELPAAIDGDAALLQRLEAVRGMAAVRIGFIGDYRSSAFESPTIPKMTVVSPARDYAAVDGRRIAAQQIDLTARMMSMQKAHPTYAMTGAMCTAAAAAIPGSVVQQALRPGADTTRIRIGHPSGVMEAGVAFTPGQNEAPNIEETWGFRTANFLMDGFLRMEA